MKQYEIKGSNLTLRVKQAPVFVRGLLFVVAFLFFIHPLVGIIFYAPFGGGFHFWYFIWFAVYGVLGFYLLRLALWNTYGKEKITIGKNSVNYFVDYGWVKDKIKEAKIDAPITFSVNLNGYSDRRGRLMIGHNDNLINSAVRMPLEQLQELIGELNKTQVT